MANTFEHIAKAVVDGLWLQMYNGMATKNVPGLKNLSKLRGARTLIFTDIDVEGFGKYAREDGTGIGEYARKSVKTKEYALEVDMDLSYKFSIDVIDIQDSGNILTARNILQKHNKKYMIPAMDRCYFSKLIWKNEAGTEATGATIKTGAIDTIDTPEELLKEFDLADIALTDAGVPKTGRILYCYPYIAKIFNAIKRKHLTVTSNDKNINTAIASLDDITIIETPKDRMHDKVSYTTTETDANAKQLHFVLVHNPSTFRAIRRNHLKIMPTERHIESDSLILARRLFFTHGIYPLRSKAVYIYKDA